VKSVRRSPLLALFLTVFIDLLGFGLFLPSLTYMAGSLQASDTQIGLLQASFSIAQFTFAPFWGWLSDRIGRRPVMLISIAGTGLSYLLFGLSRSLPMLFLARSLTGGFSANIAAAQAFVTDVTTPENRAKGMGIIGAAFGLGFTLGPPMGGFLAGEHHFERPALVAAAMCAINLVWAAIVLPESRPAAAPVQRREGRMRSLFMALASPQLGVLIVLLFVAGFAFANVEQALILATRARFQWTPVENGKLLGLVGVLIVVMQGGLVGPLSRRFGERWMLVVGTIFMTLALGMLAISTMPSGYWFAMVPLALGNGMTNPALSSLISRAAHADERGSTLGVSQSASSVARIFAPLWAGWSFQHIGLSVPFATGALIMAVAVLIALSLPGTQPSLGGEVSEARR
jgi:DHA1 family tetracycline resistance protein-like MFS transporter